MKDRSRRPRSGGGSLGAIYIRLFSTLVIVGIANILIMTAWIAENDTGTNARHQAPPGSKRIFEAGSPTMMVNFKELPDKDTPHKNKSNSVSISGIRIDQGPFNTTMISCIQERKVCRYDDIGDFLESRSAKSFSSGGNDGDSSGSSISNMLPGALVHKPMTCIPPHRRIPHQKANDWPYILEQRNAQPEDGSMTALMDYNAMLIPLYKNVKVIDDAGGSTSTKIMSDLDPSLLDHLTGKYHSYFSDEEVNRVKYLSISRTSNLHACKPRFEFHFGTLAQDFIGISLLDDHLQRIEGTDIAINFDKWVVGNMTAIFHDFRVVAAKSTRGKDLKDQLFLTTSGHLGTYLFPMDIRRMPPVSAESVQKPWNTKLKGAAVPRSSEFQYGSGMEVRFVDDPGRFADKRVYSRGDLLFKDRGLDRGKNFHFFESSEGKTYMEMWPHGYNDPGQRKRPFNSHVAVPVDFFSSSFEPLSPMNAFPGRREKFVKGKRKQVEFLDEIRSLNGDPTPKRSFDNEVPKHLRPNMKFRGTSQIIDMTLNGAPFKVGISHSVAEGWIDKETNERHTDHRTYLSQFYAFSPDPPFEVVAITGHFCFNHMLETDDGYSAQWVSERAMTNRTAPIMVHDEEIRCPLITFASGMTEMIGRDGNNVIITYGVDDCYSRSIIVPKKKIELLLLGQVQDGATAVS